ncbi:MAG: Bax inhibitor-1/YccA family protein [Pyrinomonadaceae bacterium]|nr:Bax inhibitor-1/YccA family protein [Phycisphaerales bacterium]
MFRSTNPTMKSEVFARPQTWADFQGDKAGLEARTGPRVMTLNGTIIKSMILLGICSVTALGTWQAFHQDAKTFAMLGIGGVVLAIILGLIITFRRHTAPFLAPIYAVCEGAFVGWISAYWAAYAAGGAAGGTAARGASSKLALLGTDIVLQAGLLTFGISAAMLIAYSTRLIRPSQKLMGAIAAITGGVLIFSLIRIVMSMIFPGFMANMWSSPIGIAFAGFIVILAAANLVIDFAVVEEGVQNGAPKYMEWYAGWGLLVTIVWLYVSILRLLALLSRSK